MKGEQPRLAIITDNSSSTYTIDFETTGSAAFTYNNLGQMTKSDADGVDQIYLTTYSLGSFKIHIVK